MFCSQCGTKVNDGAKFCFNCGAKIVGTVLDTNKVAEVEKKIPEELVVYVEGKCIEAYVQGKKMLAETFYKKADFYEVQPEQVNKIVSDCEIKVSKIEKYIDGLYEDCNEFELYEEEYDEITAFGNSLGFDHEEVDEIVDYYEQTNHIEEKQKLYSECVLAYMDDGKTHFNSSECVEKYQEVVYKVFEKNILYMEKLLEEQYGLSKEFELNQEQKDLIYLEGSKRFPEDAIVGIVFGYDKKNGILKFREEKEKQKALERMKFFNLYGEQIAFTEEECTGIAVGKNYRKVFNRLQKEFSTFSNNADVTEEGYWDAANEKVIYLIKVIYEAMIGTLQKKGISQEDISNINAMDLCQYWIPVFEDIDYKYNEICYGTEAAEYYRRVRKEKRGKIIGGGFGIVGAAKGIVTAGAINAMTGVAYSAFNLVGSIKDKLKKRYAIKELLGYSLNEKVDVVLKQTLQWAYLAELAIGERYNISSKGFRLFYDKQAESEKNVAVKLLSLHPFNETLYESIIMSLGIDNGMDKLAQFTGIEIEKAKANRKQKEREERTEDGIEFPTLEDKKAYCKERDLFKPLLEEIRSLNVYANKVQFDEKVNLLKRIQPQAEKYWKKEVADVLHMCEQKSKGTDIPNKAYLMKILGMMPINVKSYTVISEENDKFNYWLEYFGTILKRDTEEKIVLFILNSDKTPDIALIFTTHHIYFYYVSKDDKQNVLLFDFEQICDLRFSVNEKEKNISKFNLILTNNTSLDLWRLFNYEHTPNYKYSVSFYEALKACVEMGFKQKASKESIQIREEIASLSSEDKYNLAMNYLKGKAGLEKNEIVATKLLEELSEEEYANAQWSLGYYFYYYKISESFDSSFTAEDEEDRKKKKQQAVVLFERAAKNGQADGQNMLGTFYSTLFKYRNETEKKDDKLAVELFVQSAKQGNAEAKKNLAMHYFEGKGVGRNISIALQLLNESASKGNLDAQLELAERYHNGKDVKKSIDDAIYWYNEAAQQGSMRAKNDLRKFKQRDIERALSRRKPATSMTSQSTNNLETQKSCVSKDKEELSIKKNEALSDEKQNSNNKMDNKEQEELREKYELAVMYEEGDSESKDIKTAVDLYKELSELGYSDAQWRLARCYNCGTGVTKDVKLAVELFTKAAEQGNVASMDALGYIYSSLGKKEWKVDDEKSLYWWTEAATRMNVAAQYNLNIYYSTIQKDLKKRLYWLEESAKNGHAIAQNKLAELYFEGKDVEKDFKKTAYWFTQSAKNGYAHGQYGLGVCYANGVGVEKSKDEAKYWFGEASKQGHEEAKKELKRLEGGCYITTAVCESFGKPDNCYELQSFRKFRDEWLMCQPDGKTLIDEYYCTAPEIVEKIKNRDEANLIYKAIWEKYLQLCLEYIESKQYEKCKELYTEMVYTMKKKYCEGVVE